MEENQKNENRRSEALETYYQWILTQTGPQYRMYEQKGDPDVIVLETDYCRGEVAFYPMGIIQLSVVNTVTQKDVFFLHFQLKSQEHARSLFLEMRESILALSIKPVTKILLCCTSGLTTGYFAQKLNESAALLDLDLEFSAVSYNLLYQTGPQYSIILLAPQISYLYDDVNRILEQQLVLRIPPRVFASYDVTGLLKELSPYLESAAFLDPLPKKDAEQPAPSICREIVPGVQTLIIALIHESEDRYHFASRIYDRDHSVLYDRDILKPRFCVEDIYDICDTAFCLFPEVEVIGVAIPGIISDEGAFSLKSLGFENVNITALLSERYRKKVLLENDANCIAMGYYATQDKYSCISFLFQPEIDSTGGVGSIVNGELVVGKSHIAGETQYLPSFSGQKHLPVWRTPEGALKLVTELLATVTCILGPELILLSSHLILRADAIEREMEKYIPRQYVPEVRILRNLREYMLLGMMVACSRAENAA